MSLANGDLTTLATAKSYLASPPSDFVLGRLISGMSRAIMGVLNRDSLVPRAYSDVYNGSGTYQLVLPNWPLLSVSSFYIGGVSYSEAAAASSLSGAAPYGWQTPTWNGMPPGDPAVLELVGGSWFTSGLQNVAITYEAGYQVTAEAGTIPVTTTFTVSPHIPFGSWASDRGVTYSNGVALAAIASGTPLAGQYLPPDPNGATPRLVYTFAAADAGLGVLLTYGYIPFDVENAALDLIQERAAYRTRIGVRSQSLAAQESISYDTSGVTVFIERMLGSYISVLPPAMGASV